MEEIIGEMTEANDLLQKMMDVPLEISEYYDLDKRDIMAANVFCSLLSKHEVSLYQSNKVLEEKFERIAALSVKAADKLIDALNKQP